MLNIWNVLFMSTLQNTLMKYFLCKATLTVFFEYYLTHWVAELNTCGWTWVNL